MPAWIAGIQARRMRSDTSMSTWVPAVHAGTTSSYGKRLRNSYKTEMTTALNFKAVLAVPFFCTGMERHIARRCLRILSQLPDSHVGTLPINFIFARVDRIDDFIGVFIGQRFAGVERPATVVDTLVI